MRCLKLDAAHRGDDRMDIDDPEHLRMRAAEMRARAGKAVHPEIKRALSFIADDYDLLAKRAEQRFPVLARPKGDDQPAIDDQKVPPNATQDATVSEFPLE